MSEAVERRLLDVLGHPTESPYGNPIPGLEELGEVAPEEAYRAGLVALDAVSAEEPTKVVVRRIGEPIQTDSALMSRLRRAGVRPGAAVSVHRQKQGLLLGSGGESTEITPSVAAHVFVAAR